LTRNRTSTGPPQSGKDADAPFRILHVLAPAPFGGLETVVQSLAVEQCRSGQDVHVAAILDPHEARHPLLEAVERTGATGHVLRAYGRRYWREIELVRELCADTRPDVLHTHGYRPDVLLGRLARKLRIPIVSTVHGFTGGDFKNRVYQELQRRAYLRFDAVVAVSRPMAAELARRGISPERLHCVPNAWAETVPFVDRMQARQALGIHPNDVTVGFIGRLGREKGPDTFIDALQRVRGEYQAVVVGDGAMMAELVGRANQLGLDGTVRWAGAVDGAGRLIKALDMVVLSSRTEGTPMVLLEAMAAGVPIVATRVGGVPDVITDREAVLVAPDDPVGLGEAISHVLRNRDAAQCRADVASARLTSEFGAARWLERYNAVYRSCSRTRSA
jgi:glycosyltransferase involved in cell wall biosynthesis